ncbi:MAG: MFS transporter, partial [Sciscionella sp.]
ASPFAAKLGEGPIAVGLIMAADPLGSVLGAFCFARFLPTAARNRAMIPFAACGGLALVLPMVHPSLLVGIAGFALSGAFSAAYQIHATASITRVVPNVNRSGALGLTNSSMIAVQGLGVAVGGVIAEAIGPVGTIALGGVIGALLACTATPSWNRQLATRSELTRPR